MGQKKKEQELTNASCCASHMLFVAYLNYHKSYARNMLISPLQVNIQVPNYTPGRCEAGV